MPTRSDATSPNDRAYWVAVQSSVRARLDLVGPLSLYDAFDESDRLKRQHGMAARVSTAYRAADRTEALANASFHLARTPAVQVRRKGTKG